MSFAHVFATLIISLLSITMAGAWTPLAVEDDVLVRMPGTQPTDGVTLEAPNRCLNCHKGYDPLNDPGTLWAGSMMAQAARDPIFWATMLSAILSPLEGRISLRSKPSLSNSFSPSFLGDTTEAPVSWRTSGASRVSGAPRVGRNTGSNSVSMPGIFRRVGPRNGRDAVFSTTR